MGVDQVAGVEVIGEVPGAGESIVQSGGYCATSLDLRLRL